MAQIKEPRYYLCPSRKPCKGTVHVIGKYLRRELVYRCGTCGTTCNGDLLEYAYRRRLLED